MPQKGAADKRGGVVQKPTIWTLMKCLPGALAVMSLSVIWPSASLAQLRDLECPTTGQMLSTAEQKGILARTQSTYEQVNGIAAQFSQESYLKALEVSEVSEGKVIFKKSGNMRWEYSAPEEQTFLIANKTFWLFQPKDKQLLIDNVQEVLLSELPVAFLMGIGSLTKQFDSVGGCKSQLGILLVLRPAQPGQGNNPQASADNQLKSFTLLVDEATLLPKGAKTTDVGGNETAIVLSGVERDPKFSDASFAPNFPGDVDVQDKRGG